MAKNKSRTSAPNDESVSFVSEWFGFRVYPVVAKNAAALATQQMKFCPFLSEVTGDRTQCIKSAAASGICNISSRSNGPRQDWLVCPFRAFSPLLLDRAAFHLFPGVDGAEPMIIPAPSLAKAAVRNTVHNRLAVGERCIVYLQNKLGGEISISRTDRSPELSFDITMVELALSNNLPTVGRFGILEVQTMDFHGSYRAVVKNLEDALRLHATGFHATLQSNQQWLRDGIEGPNIANVFKRTFYQMMLKFKIGASDVCSGCVLALPKSVWESWQRHLGRPEVAVQKNGISFLGVPGQRRPAGRPKTWIIVFDIDPKPSAGPSALIIDAVIATSAEALSAYAFEVAPAAAVSQEGPVASIAAQIRLRLAQYWPELAPDSFVPRKTRVKRP
jgi:hypothetical protein